MRNATNKEIIKRLTTRAKLGLDFIAANYLDKYPRPDVAWIRNIYILLSFYTELCLKAVYACEKERLNSNELNKEFLSQSHNLEEITLRIGLNNLGKYGISSVKAIKNRSKDPKIVRYNIKTSIGKFYVEDFINIRYDFIGRRPRKIKGDEHKMFAKNIEALGNIIKSIEKLL